MYRRSTATHTSHLRSTIHSCNSGGDIKDGGAAADISGNGINGMIKGGVTATTGQVAEAEASITNSSLAVGIHVIEADYAGEGDYAAAATTAMSTSSIPLPLRFPSPTTIGARRGAVTFTATVDGEDAGTPTGVVNFYGPDSFAMIFPSTGFY